MKATDEESEGPRGPFTYKYLQALKPRERRYEVIEPGRTNVRVLVEPSGRKTLYYVYKRDGERIYFRLGPFIKTTDLADLRSRVRQLDELRAQGTDPRATRLAERHSAATAVTVKEFAKRYLERHAVKHKRSWREDERILRMNVVPVWGARALRTIERADVRALIEDIASKGGGRAVPSSGTAPEPLVPLPPARRKPKAGDEAPKERKRRAPRPAPVAANRTLACLRMMFNYAVDQDVLTHSPCDRVKMVAKEAPRDRWLTEPELRVLWNGIQSLRRPMREDLEPTLPLPWAVLLMMLLTGQRKAEVIGMTWREVDLAGAWWTIPAARAKNGLEHRVPLSPAARELLEELRPLSRTWVFPGRGTRAPLRGTSVDHALRDHRTTFLLDGVPLAPFTPHDLRRTVATHLARLQVPRLVISKLLNHAEGGVTSIYDRHAYEREKRTALEGWARHLARVVAGESPEVPASGGAGSVVEFGR